MYNTVHVWVCRGDEFTHSLNKHQRSGNKISETLELVMQNLYISIFLKISFNYILIFVLISGCFLNKFG